MEQGMAVDLYKMYRNEIGIHLNLHRESLQNYLAFSAAILGATIAGILQIQGRGLVGLFLSTIPILNILICRLAISTCNRFYFIALERTALSAKLEEILGLRNKIRLRKTKLFSNDPYLLPERWITDTQQYKLSSDFIREYSSKGINRIAQQTFQILIGINVLLIVVVVFIGLA
ncbi:MAG TPA: hypothetical protein VK206_13820 [Anaerolineales bacterium]|nr:hypothetical protein [Anaerolineales bacterium]